MVLDGRAVAILVSEGADGKLVKAIKKAAESEGASVKIVAPKVGGVALQDGVKLKADGQLAGTPSFLFDAVALVLSKEGCADLMNDSAASDFITNAFGHLKAIGLSKEAWPLLEKAGIERDEAVVELEDDLDGFLLHARKRLWVREPKVRVLA